MAPKSAIPIANLSEDLETLHLDCCKWIGQSTDGLPMIPTEGEVKIRVGCARVSTSREDIDDGFFEYPESVHHKNLIKGMVLRNDEVELHGSLGPEYTHAVSLLPQFVRQMHLKSTLFVVKFARPSSRQRAKIKGSIYVFRVYDFRPTRPLMYLSCPMTERERFDVDRRIPYDKMMIYTRRMQARFQVAADGIHLQLDMETDENGNWGECTDLDRTNIVITATYLGLLLLQTPLNFDLSSSTPSSERIARFLDVGVEIFVRFGKDSSHWKSFSSFARALKLEKTLEEKVQSL